jgi:hypothetical protein
MIRASVSAPYLNLTWAVSYVLPVVDVSYVLITFDAATDDLGRYRRLRDAFIVSESLANHLVKVRADGAEVAESYSAAVGKSLSDAFTASELFSRVVSYIRSFSDGAQTAESYASEFGKPSTDEALAGDSDPVRAFGKGLSSIVGATDDLDGAASILDDQVMFFFKATGHYASASDLFDRAVIFNRGASDVSTAVETLGWALGNTQADTSQTLDVNSRQVNKSTADLSVIGDSFVQLLGKLRSDSATSADSGALLNQDYTSDPFYFADDYVGTKRIF